MVHERRRPGPGRVEPRPGLVHRRTEDGSLSSRRGGGGGLVSGLSAIGPDADAVWVCAALGDGDREAVRPRRRRSPASRMLAIEPEVRSRAAYNGIANSVLWFVHHLLYQTPLEPVFDEEFRGQWASFEAYNAAFADALAEEAAEGARGPRAGLPPDAGPRAAPRAPPRPADRPLHAHPVGAAGLLPAAARRRRRRRCWRASSARTGPAFLTRRWARRLRRVLRRRARRRRLSAPTATR